jgi:hypothetical protein
MRRFSASRCVPRLRSPAHNEDHVLFVLFRLPVFAEGRRYTVLFYTLYRLLVGNKNVYEKRNILSLILNGLMSKTLHTKAASV